MGKGDKSRATQAQNISDRQKENRGSTAGKVGECESWEEINSKPDRDFGWEARHPFEWVLFLTTCQRGAMKTKLSDAKLLDYSGEHLLHELNMFWQLAGIVPKMDRGFMLSALLESFALHLRNLIDFFYNKSGPKGYVIARHFFDLPGGWMPKITPALGKALTRANEEVSHLTLGRKSGDMPDKLWDADGLFKEIEAVAKDFGAKASKKKLHPKVLAFLDLSNEKALVWLKTNATYSNATSQTVTFSSSPGGAGQSGKKS